MKTTKQLITLAILMGLAGQIKAISTPSGAVIGRPKPQPGQPINVPGGPSYNPQAPQPQPGQPMNIPGGPSYNPGPQPQPSNIPGGPSMTPQGAQPNPGQPINIPGGPSYNPQVNSQPIKAPNLTQPAVKPAAQPGSGYNR